MILEIIIGFVSVILTEIIFILSYKKLNHQSLNLNFKKIMLLLGFAILIILNNLFNVKSFKVVTTILIFFLLIKYWYKDSNKKVLFYTIMISLSSMIIELWLTQLIGVNFLNLELLNKSFIAKSSYTIIMVVANYFFYTIPIIAKVVNKLEQIMTKRRAMEVYLIVIVFIVNLLLMQMTVNYRNAPLYFVSITIIVMIF